MSARHARQLFFPLSTDEIQTSALSPQQVLGDDSSRGMAAPARMGVRAACGRDGRVAHSPNVNRSARCRLG